MKRAKRNLMWLAFAILAVFAFICLYTVVGTHKVSISKAVIQAQVDRQINKEFPIKGKARVLIKGVILKNTEIDIKDGTLSANIGVTGLMRLGKKFDLSAYAIGAPYYEDGAFYFRPEHIELGKFIYQGSSPGTIIKTAVEKYISSAKTQQLVKDSSEKIEEWVTETATSAAMYSLGKNPVYRLGDDLKGMIIGSSLKSVEIDDDQIILTLTLWTLTRSVFIGVLGLIAAIAILIALVQNPSLGVVFEVLSVFG